MKRSEIIGILTNIISFNRNLQSDVLAEVILDKIEELGMLPPTRKNFSPDWNFNYNPIKYHKVENLDGTFNLIEYAEENTWESEE